MASNQNFNYFLQLNFLNFILKIALVNGNYRYFHYKQDGIDDTGWGCAYRSLQTIISWYRLQGFTNLKVPSHQMIQQVIIKRN